LVRLNYRQGINWDKIAINSDGRHDRPQDPSRSAERGEDRQFNGISFYNPRLLVAYDSRAFEREMWQHRPEPDLSSPDPVQLAVALLVCCWSARSCRRCLRLGLRGRGLRRGDGNAVEPPPVANYLEHEIEIGLLRPRRDVAGQMQHAALIERGHDC